MGLWPSSMGLWPNSMGLWPNSMGLLAYNMGGMVMSETKTAAVAAATERVQSRHGGSHSEYDALYPQRPATARVCFGRS